MTLSYFAGTFSVFNSEIGITGFQKELVTFGDNSQAVLSTYHFSSSYGLFRRMTGVDGREELIIYGSDDSHNWKVYEFYHKPTKTTKMPSFIAPHQPRFDWQLWFSAMNNGITTRDLYLSQLLSKIFMNSTSVKTLISKNPFPENPPNYIKINRIIYEFTQFGIFPF